MNGVALQGGTARRTSTHRLLLLLLLSLSAYIQFAVVSRTTVIFPYGADAADYFSYAYNLHRFGTYSMTPTWSSSDAPSPPAPDAIRPPGYPLFLAMMGTPEASRAFERRVTRVQALLGVLSVLLLHQLARRFLASGAALAIAFLVAINPHFATISTYLLTESVFLFLLLASTLTLVKAVAEGRAWLFAATGILWGACSLVRSTVEFLPPLFLLAVLVLPRLRQHLRNALLAFACFVAVLSPWIIRNQSPALSPGASLLAVNTLVHGSYPDFKYQHRPETFGFPYRFDPHLAEISRDVPTALGHMASQVREDPAGSARWYLLGKPTFFLSWGHVQGFDILIAPVNYTPYYQDIRFAVLRAASLFLHWPAMLSGLLGMALLCFRPGWLDLDASALLAARIVAVVSTYAIVFHMVAAPFPRYGVPFRPFLYALAALPLVAIWRHFGPEKST